VHESKDLEKPESLSSIIVPLLHSPVLEKLRIEYAFHEFPEYSNVPAIKAALETNRNLKELYIFGGLHFKEPNEITLLFQWIAAAPKLRTPSLELYVTDASARKVSPQELSESFASALKHCCNSSLESVPVFYCSGVTWDNVIWNREVIPIFNFNQHRRLYKETLRTCSSEGHGKQLIRALLHAQDTNNHHFRFWLVRHHANALQFPHWESEQA
jgi:hypothetical protein